MKKVILLSLLPFTAMAASTSIQGIGNYQDWDLVCDNTAFKGGSSNKKIWFTYTY